MIDLDAEVTLDKVTNVALIIILLELLVFGWFYFNRQNPADWLNSYVAGAASKPRYLYTIYGGNGINFNRPSYTTVHGGEIFVADTNNGRVAIFNYNGKYLNEFSGSGKGKLVYPVSICFDENKVYVADIGTKKIHVFDESRKFIGFLGEKILNEPNSVFYKEGVFFVVDNKEMKIKIINKAGELLNSFGGKGIAPGEFYFPYSVFVNEEKIYVADSNNNRIQVFDMNGNVVKILAGQNLAGEGKYSVPRGIAFDSDGNLYTAEGTIHSISKTNREGEVAWRYSKAEPTRNKAGVADSIKLPTSVFIDENQILYVTEFGKSRVLVYKL